MQLHESHAHRCWTHEILSSDNEEKVLLVWKRASERLLRNNPDLAASLTAIITLSSRTVSISTARFFLNFAAAWIKNATQEHRFWRTPPCNYQLRCPNPLLYNGSHRLPAPVRRSEPQGEYHD